MGIDGDGLLIKRLSSLEITFPASLPINLSQNEIGPGIALSCFQNLCRTSPGRLVSARSKIEKGVDQYNPFEPRKKAFLVIF